MRTISSAVHDVVSKSEPVMTALRAGHLNMSAYAKTIVKDVEDITQKTVKTGSIVIALMRLKRQIEKDPPLLPQIVIDDLSLKTGLMELVFERTEKNLSILRKLPLGRPAFADCFMVSQGVGEISIIALERAEKELLDAFRDKPRAIIRSLSSLTVRYAPSYIQTPNSLYAILQSFAGQRLNIVEIISTYTEVTLIFAEHDIDAAFRILSGLQRNNEKATRDTRGFWKRFS